LDVEGWMSDANSVSAVMRGAGTARVHNVGAVGSEPDEGCGSDRSFVSAV